MPPASFEKIRTAMGTWINGLATPQSSWYWYQRLFNFYPLYLAASDGAPLIKDNRAAFNNEYAIGLPLSGRFTRENYFSKEQQSAGQDLFIAEKIATKFTVLWEIQYLEKYKGIKWNTAFFHAGTGLPKYWRWCLYTYCDPKSIVVFNTCRDPQLVALSLSGRWWTGGRLKVFGDNISTASPAGDRQHSGISGLLRTTRLQVFAQQAKHIRGVDN